MNNASMPLEPGDRCRMRNSDEVFVVLGLERNLYGLRSAHGAELRVGKRAVVRVMEPVTTTTQQRAGGGL